MPYLAIAIALIMYAFPQVVHEANSTVPVPIVDNGGTVVSHDAINSRLNNQIPDILVKIAKCESSSRHFDQNGDVVSGSVNKFDIGRYQINTLYWQTEADKMGFDLYTEEGNEAMALYLFRKYGTDPWRSSQKCWVNA